MIGRITVFRAAILDWAVGDRPLDTPGPIALFYSEYQAYTNEKRSAGPPDQTLSPVDGSPAESGACAAAGIPPRRQIW